MAEPQILEADRVSFFALAKQLGDPKPLKRIFSLMRAHRVKTIVLEDSPLSPSCVTDLALMETAFKRKCERKRTRISFFAASLRNARDIKRASNSSYLGYAIVSNDLRGPKAFSFVAESVTKPPMRDNDFVHSQSRYECAVLGTEFALEGSYFAEKDRFTSSCAHIAVKIAVENMRTQTKKTMTYHEMNDFLNIDYAARMPADGFNRLGEIEKVLKQVDLVPIVFDYEKRPPKQITYQQATYYAVESSWPAIIVFQLNKQLARHAITVIGHKFEPDWWLPEVQANYFELDEDISYQRSVDWTSSFKIQDDNYGPYYNLPANYFLDKKPTVIAVAPQALDMYGHQAEVFAYAELINILSNPENLKLFPGNKWQRIARDHIANGKIILRTLHMSRGEYLAHIKKRDYFADKNLRTPVIRELPRSFWLAEMSVPELFTANKSKIGELIIDPSAQYPHTVKAIWLSGTYYLVDSNQYLLMSSEEYYPLA